MTQAIQTDSGGLVKEKSCPFDFLGIRRQRLFFIFCGSLLSPKFLILLFLIFSYTANSKISAKSRLPNRPITFLDIAALAHLDTVNTYGGDLQKDFIIETTGNGSIIFDFDNDGWPDIFCRLDPPCGSPQPVEHRAIASITIIATVPLQMSARKLAWHVPGGDKGVVSATTTMTATWT